MENPSLTAVCGEITWLFLAVGFLLGALFAVMFMLLLEFFKRNRGEEFREKVIAKKRDT